MQYGGIEALTGPQSGPQDILATLRTRRDATVDMLTSMPGVEARRPEAGFYIFPDVTEALRAKGIDNVTDFAEQALVNTGVSFCTRHHFGRPQPGEDRSYLRLAFSGIDEKDITEGLGLLADWIRTG